MPRPIFRDKSVLFEGKTYQVGQEFLSPEPLPDFLPTVLPAGWHELDTTGWTAGLDRDYARAYVKHQRVKVLISCARYQDGKRWLHVSVSRANKETPNWECMSEVKDLFIGAERTALQVMPPRSKHVNIANVLHLWCPLDGDVTPDFTAGGQTI
jgi:hypothetical protein